MRLVTFASVAVLATAVASCGGVAKTPVEPAAREVKLEVLPARMTPKQQYPGDQTTLSITIKNVGSHPAPLLAVTLGGLSDVDAYNPADEGRTYSEKDDLPGSNTRSPWFVDEGPDGSAIESGNTYLGGRLEPGRTRTLRWKLNARRPGTHTITYDVVSGLTDTQARATRGTGLSGSLTATISDNPAS